MICCINEDTGEIKLVSIYRDTYLNISDKGSYRKFNAAYTNGGPKQALEALNKNLDLNITQYVTFSWKSVADGINILGGVDLEITKSEFRYINSFITETVNATGVASKHLPNPGPHHLDGVQAVAYGRLRLMDTDFARTERQRKIIELAFAKAKKADYSVLNNILVVILPNISTNISFADMTSMALSINKYHIGETAGFPFAKGNADIPGKGDCVIPQTLESNVSQLHTFLFGDESYEPTEQVKTISNKIASDSGMYKEGKVSTKSALSTDDDVPRETAKETTAREETSKERETREKEEETSSEEETLETDEDGELIDGPIDDWPEDVEPLPSGNGQLHGIEGGPGGSSHPGSTTTPGGSVPYPGGSTYPGSITTPGGSVSYPGGTGPEENEPGGTTSEGNTPLSPGDTTPGGVHGGGPGAVSAPGNTVIGPGGASTEVSGPGIAGGTEAPEESQPSEPDVLTPDGGDAQEPGGQIPQEQGPSFPGETTSAGNSPDSPDIQDSPGGISPGDGGPGSLDGGDQQTPQGPGL